MRYALSTLVLVLICATFAPAQTPAKTALMKRLPTVKFADVSLIDAIDFFRDASNANLVVDWKSIEEIGVSKDTAVSLGLRYTPMRVALKATLESAAPGLLAFYVDQNVITITTLARADEKMITRIYPVQDLLVDIPDFEGPSLSLTDNASGGRRGRGNGNGGSGGGIFDSGSSDRDKDSEKSKSRSEKADDLVSLIQETIRPDVWDINGGKARIKFFNGTLIVTAPRSVHEAIGGPIE